MKAFWRRLGAWTLVLSMLLPMAATGTPALAAGGGGSSAKPELFIDFLGDNWNSGTSYRDSLAAPLTYHLTDPNIWDKYGKADCNDTNKPIFWVGVGINNVNAFQLVKDGLGLYSAELGFYYDSTLVKPYEGDGYKTTLETYNLNASGNTDYQWASADYEIVTAVADAGRQMQDTDTQEYAPKSGWKLTHVSLRKKTDSSSANRLSDVSALVPDNKQYLMVIPFQVLDYPETEGGELDTTRALCFRLARSASLFSIGGGAEGWTLGRNDNDTSSYGAWERETLNPNHNLKDMLEFTGDLNIFTGEKEKDDVRNVNLRVMEAVAGSSDAATLYRTYDPLSDQVTATNATPTATLTGLTVYTSVTLEVSHSSDVEYTVECSVPYVQDADDADKYTFLMPDDPFENVDVRVIFHHDAMERKYRAKLEMDVLDEDGTTAYTGLHDNSASLEYGSPVLTISPGGSAEVDSGTTMTIRTVRDPDFDMTVVATGANSIPLTDNHDGTYTFNITTNTTVKVTYTKAKLHKVTLAVDADSNGLENNLARLSYRAWDWVQSDATKDDWAETPKAYNGKTGSDDNNSFQVRDGREMTVGVAVQPGFRAHVYVTPAGGSTTELTLKDNPDSTVYPKVTTFAMPAADTQVKVEFTALTTKNVKAIAINAEVDTYPTNYFELSATDEVGDSFAARSDKEGGKDDNFNVMEGTEVTVTLHHDDNYHISDVKIVKIIGGVDAGQIIPTGRIVDGELKFKTPTDPAADVEVRVTYQAGARQQLSARLTVANQAGTTDYYWEDQGNRLPGLDINVLEGDELTAKVTVRPGWYIDWVEVRGATDVYTHNLTGNGWNNGAADPVTETITFTMPGENVEVIVWMREGPPDPEPTLTAKLQVTDDDNADGSVDNWAKIQVGTGSALPANGVKKGSDNPYSTNVNVGDLVTVTFGAGEGYHVESVTLGPETEGSVTWVDDHTVTYVQGGVNTIVTVVFKEGAAPPRTATLHLVDSVDADNATLTSKTTADSITASEKTTSNNGGTVKALAGDTIEISATPDTDRYVTAVYVRRGGTLIPITPTLPTGDPLGKGEQKATFVIPDGDVDVYVVFSDSEHPPQPDQHTVILTVTDLSGGAIDAAGRAVLTADSNSTEPAPSNGASRTMSVSKGKTVTVQVTCEEGYSIDSILLSSGSKITLHRQSTNTAWFVMPAEDVGVEVRLKKGDPTTNTATIILRAPTGVVALDAGDAWFQLDNTEYPGVYSMDIQPGKDTKVNIRTNNGYYIESVTVTPAALGIGTPIPGVFGLQTTSFTMPAADIYVNVTFGVSWPVPGSFEAKLKVEGVGPGTAKLSDTETARAASTTDVTVGNTEAIRAQENDRMEIELTPGSGHRVKRIEVKDSDGYVAPYYYVGSGKVAFNMPGGNTVAVVEYEEGEAETRTATLKYDTTDGDVATITNSVTPAQTTNNNNGTITGYAGDVIDILGTPRSNAYQLYAVIVTAADGSDVPLLVPVTNNGNGTYSASVAMQDQDITIEPIFVGVLPVGQAYATLRLAGPDPAGTGFISDGTNTKNVDTCPGISDPLAVIVGDTVTVNAAPNPGYIIDNVKVTGTDGTNIPYTWTGAGQVEFTMPAQGAIAVVTFREGDPDKLYTAQIILDNGGGAGNEALLYKSGWTKDAWTRLLTAKAGERIELNVDPAVGYEVELVAVVPAKHGVTVRNITVPNTVEQDGYFIMPAGDVQVFVRFRTDSLDTYWATLFVEHGSDIAADAINTGNKAYIHSARNGADPVGPTYEGNTAGTYQVLTAKTEVVTVTANLQPGYWAEVRVTDTRGRSVPGLTVVQTGDSEWQFPMPGTSVYVTLVYHDNASKVTPRVYLHIDLATGSGTASISGDGKTTNVNLGYIEVPVNDTVTVKAKADTGHYIKDAYVLFGRVEEGSAPTGTAMLKLDYADPTTLMTNLDGTFLMQNGEVHVYVVFDEDSNRPDTQNYAGTLVVTDLTGGAVGLAGRAVMTASGGSATAAIHSNAVQNYGTVDGQSVITPLHNVITAAPGETVKVAVSIEPGFRVDGLVATPLVYGVPVVYTGHPGDDPFIYEYTFTMPEHDIGIEVQLTTGTAEGFYLATVHYLNELDDGNQYPKTDQYASAPANTSRGRVTYHAQTTDIHGKFIYVPKDGEVTMTVTPAAGYYVKRAYAISGTIMLPLTRSGSRFMLENEFTAAAGTPADTTAIFVMPEANVDVYFEFAPLTDQPTVDKRELTAGIIMTYPTGVTGAGNTGTLTREDTTAAVTAVTVTAGEGHDSLNARPGELMTITVDLPGNLFDVDTITITPVDPTSGDPVVAVQDSVDLSKFTFTMPAYDVLAHVLLKTVDTDIYTVQLRIEDRSSAIGNTASMTVAKVGGDVTVNGDGAKVTGLYGNEHVAVDVTLQPNVRVAGVVVTRTSAGTGSGSGTTQLPSTYYTTRYDTDMTREHVVITVILTDADDTDLYVAQVEIDDPLQRPENKAFITNSTEPYLNHGTIWTAAREGNEIRVDFETKEGFVAYVSAVDGNGTEVRGLQYGVTGSGYALFTMPDSRLDIKVSFRKSDDPPPELDDDVDVTLAIAGNYGTSNGNQAVLGKTADPSSNVEVTGADSAAKTVTGLKAGESLTLTATAESGYFITRITLSDTDGNSTVLAQTAGTFTLPTPVGGGAITVTYAEGERTGRPYDPAHSSVTDADAPATQAGYLLANNKGSDRLEITVPNLYDGTLQNATLNETYRLYYWNGTDYTELIEGVDYALVAPMESLGTTGVRFTIRSLAGDSVLTEYMLNGGMLYMTAAKDGSAESERTEVVIPADLNRGSYTATLRIVNNSGLPGNVARMEAAGTLVTTNGGKISGLNGDELIRTEVTPATGARISAVTVTDSTGTRLLTDSMDGTGRMVWYPYYMTGENVVITAYFEPDEGADAPTRYIATVVKTGDIDVAGNTASIRNDTRSDLSRGDIWAEGYESNCMLLSVGLAEGYYVIVTAKNMDTGAVVKVTLDGVGPGIPVTGLFTMPDADVQITVTFTKERPANLEYFLTLEVDGAGDQEGNTAKAAFADDDSKSVTANGKTTSVTYSTVTVPANPSADPPVAEVRTETKIPVGTKFKLTTAYVEGYYIEKVIQTISTAEGYTRMTITLDKDGAGEFAIPMGDSRITVYYKAGTQMPRPYDPAHKPVTEEEKPATQEGYLRADTEMAADESGHLRFEVTVPTLFDEKNTYSDANAENFKLYWKDSYGAYHELNDAMIAYKTHPVEVEVDDGAGGKTTETQQLEVPPETVINDGDGDSTNDQTVKGRELIVTATDPYGMLDYYIQNGGIIYITALDGREDPETGTLTPPRYAESPYTEVLLPVTRMATLKVAGADGSASMEVDGKDKSVTATMASGTATDGVLNGLGGNETLKTTVTPGADNKVAAVVAEVAGSAILLTETSGAYSYAMQGENATVTAILQPDNDDPWWIATIVMVNLETGEDLPTSNTATVANTTTAALPSGPSGHWAAAYKENEMEVSVTTEPGWYARITVQTEPGGADVPFIQWAGTGVIKAQFAMPDSHAKITVEYKRGSFDDMDGALTLTVAEHGGNAGNTATVTSAGGVSLTADGTDPTKSTAPGVVETGTELSLTSAAAKGYAVVSLTLVTQTGGTLKTPLTLGADGKAKLDMPRGNVELIVTYGRVTGRPFDWRHTDTDYSLGEHAAVTDHQEGYLEAERDGLGATQAKVIVPALLQYDPIVDTPANALVDADDYSFDLYYKDKDTGEYVKLEVGTDYTVSAQDNTKKYYDQTTYTGSEFVIAEAAAGGWLKGKLKNGLTLYITATKNVTSPDPVWAESEKTELVIPALSGGLRPYDPFKAELADPLVTHSGHIDHWITAENRGDSLIVTVPVLMDDSATVLRSVTWSAADGELRDSFKLWLTPRLPDDGSDPIDLTTVLVFSHPDPTHDPADTTTPPYELLVGNYTDTMPLPSVDLDGARFVVTVKTDAEIEDAYNLTDPTQVAEAAHWKAIAKRVRDTMDNDGTGDTTERLKISVERHTVGTDGDPITGALVELEVRSYYELKGIVESYAPQRETTFDFYALDKEHLPQLSAFSGEPDATAAYAAAVAAYLADRTRYAAEPAMTFTNSYTRGTGLWQLDVALKSSLLMGEDGQGATWMLVIKKPGHVTFTWYGLELTPAYLDTPIGHSFTISQWDEDMKTPVDAVIALYGGDADEDGRVTAEDYYRLLKYTTGKLPWNRSRDESAPAWADSVFNPASRAYVADTTGDGRLGLEDAVWDQDRNLGKRETDYPTLYLQRYLKAYPLTSYGMLDIDMMMSASLEEMAPEELLEALLAEELTLDDILTDTDADQLQGLLEALSTDTPELSAEDVERISARLAELAAAEEGREEPTPAETEETTEEPAEEGEVPEGDPAETESPAGEPGEEGETHEDHAPGEDTPTEEITSDEDETTVDNTALPEDPEGENSATEAPESVAAEETTNEDDREETAAESDSEQIPESPAEPEPIEDEAAGSDPAATIMDTSVDTSAQGAGSAEPAPEAATSDMSAGEPDTLLP